MSEPDQLTYAVRDTHIDDKTIHAGDIMGVGDHAILAVGSDVDPVALDTLREMIDEESRADQHLLWRGYKGRRG